MRPIPLFYNVAVTAVALPVFGPVESLSAPNPLASETGPRDIRAVRTLRISVTDRCNFRCVYCMPEEKIDWLPRETLLSYEEIAAVVRAAVRHGIGGFKLTGGEPLVRHDLPALVALLRGVPGVRELSMTTNGALLDEYAAPLKAAGLDRLTVSLDTMDPDRFRAITRGADIRRVWAGIRAAVAAGFRHPKINCVAMRGINDDEYAAFARLTIDHDATVRFIEYMPLGRTALGGEYEQRFIAETDIRARIEAALGPLTPADHDAGHGPACVFRLADPRGDGHPGRGRIGFISAMSKPFCSTCNRLRLTAEGQLRSCLFDGGEVELRPILRGEPLRPATHDALGDSNSIADALHAAFIRCVAFKPEVHGYYGNRQMSQIGG